MAAVIGAALNKHHGFTLLELLVVLVVLGVVSGMVMVTPKPATSHRVKTESQRLQAAFNTAQIESAKRGVAIRWVQHDQQYQFEMPAQTTTYPLNQPNGFEPRWQVLAEPKALRPHQYGDDLSILIEPQNNKAMHPEVLFLPDKTGAPMQLVVQHHNARIRLVRQWGIWQAQQQGQP